MKKAFDNYRPNKLHLTFPNGNSISLIWGAGSYTENYKIDWVDGELLDMFNTPTPSNNAEIMLLEAPKKLRKKLEKKYPDIDEHPVGYLGILEVLDILNKLAK